MVSEPGLGKSLMASIFMEESERTPFVFRKSSQENTFLDELKGVFASAKESAPSILLLEDLNLYVASRSPYAPEWACLQACIDENKDADIFVIATTNDIEYMPPSLLRPGRFDYVIDLYPPTGKVAEAVVSYYLKDKNLAEDVLISDIVKAMPRVSCATLETVMNIAALNSVYQGHEHIQIEDITDALLQVVYKLKKTDCETDPVEYQMFAAHEAAHVVVGEVLYPGSIGIVTLRRSPNGTNGLENSSYETLKTEKDLFDVVTRTLAGKAGTMILCGEMDVGVAADIQKAERFLDAWATELAGYGFSAIDYDNKSTSDIDRNRAETIRAVKMEELYHRAYKILHENMDFLLAVQKALLEHETLLNSDVIKIREIYT